MPDKPTVPAEYPTPIMNAVVALCAQVHQDVIFGDVVKKMSQLPSACGWDMLVSCAIKINILGNDINALQQYLQEAENNCTVLSQDSSLGAEEKETVRSVKSFLESAGLALQNQGATLGLEAQRDQVVAATVAHFKVLVDYLSTPEITDFSKDNLDQYRGLGVIQSLHAEIERWRTQAQEQLINVESIVQSEGIVVAPTPVTSGLAMGSTAG